MDYERESIKARYKAGQISKDEAMAALAQAPQDPRAAIKAQYKSGAIDKDTAMAELAKLSAPQQPAPPAADPQQALVAKVNEQVPAGQPQPDLSAPNLGLPQQPQAMMSGAQALPPEMVRQDERDRQQNMSLRETIVDMFTGESRMTDKTRSLQDIGEMDFGPMTSPKAWWQTAKAAVGSLAAGPTETADIAVEQLKYLGKNPETGKEAHWYKDEKGNPIIYNPYDNKEYAVKPGMDLSDALGGAAAILAEINANMLGAGWLTKLRGGTKAIAAAKEVPSMLKATGAVAKEGMKGAAAQAAHEGLQAATGGEFSGKEVALGGALDVGGEAVVRGVSALKNQYGRVINKVLQGGPDAKETLKAMKAKDPVGVNSALADQNLVMDQQGNITPKTFTPEEALLGAERGNLPYREIPRSTTTRPEAQDWKEQGFDQYITSREIMDPDDPTSTLVFDSVSELGADLDAGLRKFTNDYSDIVGKVSNAKNLGEVSNNMAELFKKKKNIFENSEKKLYERVNKAVPQDATADTAGILDKLEERIDTFQGIENLSKYEQRLYKAIKKDDKMKADLTGKVRDTEFNYQQLDALRKDAGSILGSTSDEAGIAKMYYGLINEAQEGALDTMAIDEATKKTWIAAKELHKKNLQLGDDMSALFGNEFRKAVFEGKTEKAAKDVVTATTTAMKQASTGGVRKLNAMVDKVPKSMRKDYVVQGILENVGKIKGESYELSTFGDFWANARKDDAFMSFLSDPKNMGPEKLKLVDAVGTMASAVSRSKKNLNKEGGPQHLKDILEQKETALAIMFRELQASIGSSLIVGGVGYGLGSSVEGAGYLSTGVLGLAALRVLRGGLKTKTTSDHVKAGIALLRSPKIKKALLDPNTKIDIKELSKTDQARQFFRKTKIGSDPNAIERYFKSQMRAIQSEEQDGN